MPVWLHSPELSIIIPVYNEEGNIAPLLESIHNHCGSLTHEILVVNDGSTDGTRKELEGLKENYPALIPIHLKKNFGQTAAMAAGIDRARSPLIVTIDGDGQNDPADIPLLVDHIRKGYDVVSGWRKNRKDAFLSRKLPSGIANFVISKVTNVPLHDYGCTLKAYRSNLIKNIQISGEMHRFLPAWCAWRGGKIMEVAVSHHARRLGASKYGMMRTFKVLIDLMTVKFFSGFLTKPNYLFSGSGLMLFIVSLIAAGLAFFDKFGPDRFPQYRIPLLLLSVFLGLVSISLFFMGLLAEILSRMYFSISQQKPYVLDEETPS